MNKEKTVLMVMDFQNDIVHEKGKFAGWGIPAHVQKQQAIKNTAKLLERARKAGMEVIYVTVSYEEGYPELANSKMPLYAGMKQGGALIKGQWGAKIHELLTPKEGEKIFNKVRTNPFSNPTLEKALAGKETLIVTGVATNFVVEDFTRTAAARDFEVIVCEDCCASMNQEAHDFSMKIIFPNMAKIVKSSEIKW